MSHPESQKRQVVYRQFRAIEFLSKEGTKFEIMKKTVKKFLAAFGYEISRTGNSPPENFPFHYPSAVLGVAARQGPLNVVVIGANDGRINDPVYPMLSGPLKDRTSVTLFEPQEALIPYLRETYAQHGDCKILTRAVGSTDEITLYSVRPEFWSRCQPDYAAGWPAYRAPTGVTSSDFASVADWLKPFLGADEDPQDIIAKHVVPAGPLVPALESAGRSVEIDILQVDAEGFDDQVLFCCALDRTRPALIYFEAHVPQDRLALLTTHLEDLGYRLYRDGENIACLLLNCPSKPAV